MGSYRGIVMFGATSLRVLLVCVLASLMALIVMDFFMIDRHWFLRSLQILAFVVLSISVLVAVFLRWVAAEESTAVVIRRGGVAKRIGFFKRGHYLDENYNLVEDPDYVYTFSGSKQLGDLLGGLMFYAWYFEEVYIYDWAWEKTLSSGEVISRHEEGEYLTYVGYSYPYGMKLGDGVITRDRIPVMVNVIVTAMLVNPYKALFNGKWFISLISIIRTPTREHVNSQTYEAITAAAGGTVDEDELFDDLSARIIGGTGRTLFQVLLEDHGVKVISVAFASVSLTPEYQALTAQKTKGEMDAAQRNASGMGAIVAMVGTALGMTVAEVQARFKDPTPFTENELRILEASRDLLEQQIASAAPGSSALKSYRFKGASGGMDLVALIGDALRGSGGSASSTSTAAPSSSGGDKPDTPDSDEKAIADYERRRGIKE